MQRQRTRPIVQKAFRPHGKLSIKEARRLQGMMQTDLAKLVGLPQILISFIESGYASVPHRDRPKWAWALGLREEQILWEKEQ